MNVEEIAARLAIQELANRYTDAILRNDVEAYADCWSEAASWHIMGQIVEGRNAIVTFYKTLTEQARHVRHVAHSPILKVAGAGAEGRWQVTETICGADGSGSVILGVYDDTYANEESVWRFTERKIDIVYQGPVAFDKDLFAPLSLTNHPF